MALCAGTCSAFAQRAVAAAQLGSRRALSATAPAKEEAAKPPAFSLRQWYEDKLHTAPLVTKMVTGCSLWGLGDLVAQAIPIATQEDAEPYDLKRTGRACVFGMFLHAPLAHLHYNFLEWLTVRVKPPGSLGPTVFKTVMEQFVYWSWCSNALYHGGMGAMQGMGATEIYDRLVATMWPTMKAQWVFWIPVQLINFKFTPVAHQLNVVLATSVVWTAFLSLAFPPVKQTKLPPTEDASSPHATAATA